MLQFHKTILPFSLSFFLSCHAWAAVSAEEAGKLGTTLTPFGAEKAGNADGTIPAYTGGLPSTTSPSGFAKGSGRYVSPFASEKPLFSISAQNVDKYADKLNDASIALLKRYPSYRMDVYPTHRSVNYPKSYLDATVRNATTVPSIKDGDSPLKAAGGIPFPIPKTGYEVVWNQLVRYMGPAADSLFNSYYVDASGKPVLGAQIKVITQWMYNFPGITTEKLSQSGNYYWQAVAMFQSPARTRGDATMFLDNLTPERKAYSYSASTRRVRLAPDISYDTPITSSGGVSTYDEASGMFFGKMDRFDFKLIGKKEMYLPAHNYDLLFNSTPEQLLTPKHLNPNLLRWELHRTWVVEATLKPGYRHIYGKFVIYLDEDGSGMGARDNYDSSGKLIKGIYVPNAWLYDVQVPYSYTTFEFDLSTGAYAINTAPMSNGYHKLRDSGYAPSVFTADSLSSRSGQ